MTDTGKYSLTGESSRSKLQLALHERGGHNIWRGYDDIRDQGTNPIGVPVIPNVIGIVK